MRESIQYLRDPDHFYLKKEHGAATTQEDRVRHGSLRSRFRTCNEHHTVLRADEDRSLTSGNRAANHQITRRK